MIFRDRIAAGRVLAALLAEYAHRDDAIVLALPRGGVLVLNREVRAEIPELDRVLEPVMSQERQELARREAAYRRGRPPLQVRGRTAILVDDGIATGATMEAAALAMRAMHAGSIVIAVPVAPPATLERLARHADCVVCPQLTDREVVQLLAPDQPAVD